MAALRHAKTPGTDKTVRTEQTHAPDPPPGSHAPGDQQVASPRSDANRASKSGPSSSALAPQLPSASQCQAGGAHRADGRGEPGLSYERIQGELLGLDDAGRRLWGVSKDHAARGQIVDLAGLVRLGSARTIAPASWGDPPVVSRCTIPLWHREQSAPAVRQEALTSRRRVSVAAGGTSGHHSGRGRLAGPSDQQVHCGRVTGGCRRPVLSPRAGACSVNLAGGAGQPRGPAGSAACCA